MRKYAVGINVNNADELEGMGVKLRAFFDAVGQETEIDIQISVNPLLTEPINTHAIGFVAQGDGEEYYEVETEDDEQ